jgi:uncharacterized protein (TIGR00369 family)
MANTREARVRTVTWEDPAPGRAAAPSMGGLDFLRAIARGELPEPPIARLLGLSIDAVEEGRVVFSFEPAEFHYNPIGTVHGGMAATLCDSAMGCAVHSGLPQGAGYTTLELHVNYVRPITTDTGRLSCTGRLLYLGGKVATAEAKVEDAQGTLYAHATCTCLILRPDKGGP